MSRHEVRILDDHEALSRAAAGAVARILDDAVRQRGRAVVALTGGRTPLRTYGMLSGWNAGGAPPGAPPIAWDRVDLFWGDERMVPPEHADSNWGAGSAALLSAAGPAPERLHRLRGEIDPEEAAREYEAALRAALGREGGATAPLDLALLGLGADGHVASLFPGSPALREGRRWVVPAEAPGGAPRVTLTFPVLEAARHVLFLVSGEDKAGAVRSALAPDADGDPPSREGDDLPVRMLRPRRAVWMLDRAAASLLSGTA